MSIRSFPFHSILLHHPLNSALFFTFLDDTAFIVLLLSSGEGDAHFGEVVAEEDFERDYGDGFLVGFGFETGNFFFLQQEQTLALGDVVGGTVVFVAGNVEIL